MIDVPAGQLYAPYGPQRMLQIDVTPGGAMTSLTLNWVVENVRQFDARMMNLSAYLKVSTAINVGAVMALSFGTGGTPTAPIPVNAVSTDGTVTVGASFKAYPDRWRFAVPGYGAVSYGTNLDSYLKAPLSLPYVAPYTLYVLLPSTAFGETVPAPKDYDQAAESVRAARYLQPVRNPGLTYGYATVTGVNTAVLEVDLQSPMRTSPALQVVGGAGNYFMKAASGAGGGPCSAAPAAVTSAGKALITFTRAAHGFTVGTLVEISRDSGGGLYLSSELG